MVSRTFYVALLAGLLGQLTPAAGVSQDKGKPNSGGSRTVTKWVSERSTDDPKVWVELGRYDTLDEAVACSLKFSEENKKSDKIRMTRETQIQVPLTRPDPGLVENSTPKGGAISKPNGKSASVAGKTGTGTIGKAKVTITFTGKGGKGTFVVSGDLTGEGEWQQDGEGVVMETKLSRFRGVLKGNQLSGVRTTKDGSQPLTEWSVTLTETPGRKANKGESNSPAGSRSAPKVTELTEEFLVGTWKDDPRLGHTYTFARGGTGEERSSTGTLQFRWQIEDKTRLSLTRTGGNTNWGEMYMRLENGKLMWGRSAVLKKQ